MITPLTQALFGHFVFANLGAGGDVDPILPDNIRQAVTLVEIDAGSEPINTKASYYARHRIRNVIAGSATPRTFYQRSYWGSSSLLEAEQKVIEKYGIEKPFQVISTEQVVPSTLPEIMAQLELGTLDFLKTDLEGLDFEVIQSLADYLPKVLAVQCELRFEPIYIGEPLFYDVAKYLYNQDFILIGLRPEFWKPKTPHQTEHLDGTAFWADWLFMKRPENLFRLSPDERSLAQAKQIIIATMLGKKSYADYLLQLYQSSLPTEWLSELIHLTGPQRTYRLAAKQVKSSIRDILYISPLWPFLKRLNKKFSQSQGLFDHIARPKDNI